MEQIQHSEQVDRKNDFDSLRDYAKLLYTRDRLTLQEISVRIGVHCNTVNTWSSAGGWKKLQRNFQATREEQVANLLDELVELNNSIREKPRGRRFADDKEGSVRRKLVRDIKELETSTSLFQVVDVCKSLVTFISNDNPAKARELFFWVDKYIEYISNDPENGNKLKLKI